MVEEAGVLFNVSMEWDRLMFSTYTLLVPEAVLVSLQGAAEVVQ